MKIGKGILMATVVIEAPIIKGVSIFYDTKLEILPALGRLYDLWFPNETDKNCRTKLY